MVAQLRGVWFSPSPHGYLNPVGLQGYKLAAQALADVMAATGMTTQTYLTTLVEEGPEFLRRLPGMAAGEEA